MVVRRHEVGNKFVDQQQKIFFYRLKYALKNYKQTIIG
jgi:hypothetical protein